MLASATLKPNWDKRRDVEAFLTEWPEYVPEDWPTREVPPPREEPTEGLPCPGKAASKAQPGRLSQNQGWLLAVGVVCVLCVVALSCQGLVRDFFRQWQVMRTLSGMPLENLLLTMEADLHNPHVQAQACRRLKKIAVDQEGQVSIGSNGVKRVLESLRAHPMDETVQTHGYGALWNLAADAGHQILIVSEGGLEDIGNAFRAHFLAERVQVAGCGALSNIAAQDSHGEKILSMGLLELVMEAMKLHAGSPKVLQSACGVLWNVHKSPNVSAAIIAGGGPQLLQDIIHGNQQEGDVQFYCCGAWSSLSPHLDEDIESDETLRVAKVCAASGFGEDHWPDAQAEL